MPPTRRLSVWHQAGILLALLYKFVARSHIGVTFFMRFGRHGKSSNIRWQIARSIKSNMDQCKASSFVQIARTVVGMRKIALQIYQLFRQKKLKTLLKADSEPFETIFFLLCFEFFIDISR